MKETTMKEDAVRTLVPRSIESTEVLVSTDPGEIFLDVPASSPRYIRIREDEIVQEGDVRSREKNELESAGLTKWQIAKIDPDRVIGIDTETSDRRTWKRETLERQLVTGGLSTNLTDFERVSVTRTDGWNDEGAGPSAESVVAVAYGNDGQKFTQTYRILDDETASEERRLTLSKSDNEVESFEDDLRERFTQAVELALRSEGYAV
ncbi:hypothetical protein [Halorussus halophilus]|uniref:hypothetical protein n=1 Tax=Halorussus halophilus TaxID=2650975 RepID=UPI001CE43363|nr:hypothetical protein [Halorussus halophilus]